MSDNKKTNSSRSLDALKNKASDNKVVNDKLDNLRSQLDFEVEEISFDAADAVIDEVQPQPVEKPAKPEKKQSKPVTTKPEVKPEKPKPKDTKSEETKPRLKTFDTIAVKDEPTKPKDDKKPTISISDDKIPEDATAHLVRTFDIKRNVGITNQEEHLEYTVLDKNNKEVALNMGKDEKKTTKKQTKPVELDQTFDLNSKSSKAEKTDKKSKTSLDSKIKTDSKTTTKKVTKPAPEEKEKSDKRYNTITGKKPKIIYPDKNQEKSDFWKYDPDAKITDSVANPAANSQAEKLTSEAKAAKNERKQAKQQKKLDKQQIQEINFEEQTHQQTSEQIETVQKLTDLKNSEKPVAAKHSIKLSTIGAIIGSIVVIGGLALFATNNSDDKNSSQGQRNQTKANKKTQTIASTNQLVIEPSEFSDEQIQAVQAANPAIESVQPVTQLNGDVNYSSATNDFANAITIYQIDANITDGQAPAATNNILLSQQTAKSIVNGDNYTDLLGQTIEIRVDVPLGDGNYQSVKGQVIVTGFTDGPYDQVPSGTFDILYRAASVDQVKPNRMLVNINNPEQANEVFNDIKKLDSINAKYITVK